MHSIPGAYLGNFKQYALVDRGADGGIANRDVRGKKSIIGEETGCKTFHSGRISSQQYNFATKLYACAFWRTCSYAPVYCTQASMLLLVVSLKRLIIDGELK